MSDNNRLQCFVNITNIGHDKYKRILIMIGVNYARKTDWNNVLQLNNDNDVPCVNIYITK